MGVTHCGDNRLPRVWTGTFDEAGLAAAAERSRRAGFDLLEIPLLGPYACDLAAARRVLVGGSLEVTASLGLPEHADIGTAEPDKLRAGEALLNKAPRGAQRSRLAAFVRCALRDAEEVP